MIICLVFLESASKPAVSLFDEDEEEDLFAAPPPKQEVKQEPPKPEKKVESMIDL